jgi:hypothetical protein
MIKEKEIIVKIGNMNYKNYYEKYGPYRKGDIIIVKIEDLMKQTRIKVTAICKFCGNEKKITYQTYNLQLSRSNYYCCNKCTIKKSKETNKKRYNIDYPMQRQEVMEKSKETLIKKYNVNNISQSEEIKKKKIETCLNHYGVEYYTTTNECKEKSKKTCLEKYNVDNVSKLEFIQKKKEQTLMLNYGVLNPSQSAFLFQKSQKSGKRIKFHEKTNLWYRGSYELDFLEYCVNHKIFVTKGPTIKFQMRDKNKFYHSDFLLPEYNLICEIKSSYYYNKYIELNTIKREETIKLGYNFIFVIDKNYENIPK